MAEFEKSVDDTSELVDEEQSEAVPLVQSLGNGEAPRTLGGFVVDDDDDEEEEYTPELSTSHPSHVVELQTTEVVEQDLTNDQRLEEVPTSNELPDTPATPDSAHPLSNLKQEHDDVATPVDDGGQTDRASLDPAVPTSNGAFTDHPEHPSAAETPNSPIPSVQAVALPIGDVVASVTKARLPHDHIGMWEDRIKDDPRGDVDAWLGLINEYRKRSKRDEARKTYGRFFEIFPTAAEQWIAYAEMELETQDWPRVEQIFQSSLLSCWNLRLWSVYLNYVRRRNVVGTDKKGLEARKTITDTFEFALNIIGSDKDAGQVWQDYIQFVRSSPEQVGGSTWQDQQKMDSLRKVYQRAICIPNQSVGAIWKEYDAFELGINRQTGRKLLQEKSPSYMTARSANTALQNLTRDLDCSTLPKLPPVEGFEGDIEFITQTILWKRWIEWEKEDPLVLKEEDEAAFRNRILYVYKQAVMSLRFWPEIWYDAVDFCFSNNLENDGNELLTQGMTANPESCLLAFKQADRIESTTVKGQTEDSIRERGAAVREPYDRVLNALYDLCGKVKERQQVAETRLRENAPKEEASQEDDFNAQDAEDDETSPSKQPSVLDAQIEAMKKGTDNQLKTLGKTITYAWIALLRAMRRVQGKGGSTEGGSRQIFADARKRGRLTSEFYISNALIEYHCYQEPVATKVFDRGLKLFPEDDRIALAYIKHLINVNDLTNARAVFETSVTRFLQKPTLTYKVQPLFAYMHDFESRFGEMTAVTKLEKRMRELFPETPQVALFAARSSDADVDPTAARPVISPATQMRPKPIVFPVAQDQYRAPSVLNSPRHSVASLPAPTITLSPKRPLEDSDNESNKPNKIPRAASPLKGAAGRRLAANRSQLRQELQPNGSISNTPQPQHLPLPLPISGPAQLPQEVHRLLTMIPRADSYHAVRFIPERMADLLRGIDLSRAQLGRRDTVHNPMIQVAGQYGYPPNTAYGYPR